MKNCLNCQNEFEPKNPKGKFCSDKCKVAYSRKKPNEDSKESETVLNLENQIKGHKETISDLETENGRLVQENIKLKNLAAKNQSGGRIKDLTEPAVIGGKNQPFMNDTIKKKLGIK